MTTDFSNVTVRHGDQPLQQPLSGGVMRAWFGTPKTWEDVTFVPASVRIVGNWTPGRPLPQGRVLPGGNDGPWVRGRLERMFQVHLHPDESEEKAGMHGSFVGVFGDQGVPFVCRDVYLKTLLFFSGNEAPDVCERIANAFWGLLLSEPDNVIDYEDRMFHLGTGVWLVFGIAGGKPFVREEEDAVHEEA